MTESTAVVEKSLRSVFVGNIPYEATEEKLKDIFSQAGPVVSFKLMYDRETGNPKGYGFCEYKDQETALSAMRNINGYEIGGRPLRVDNACTEKSRMEMQNLMMGPVVDSPYGTEVDPDKAPEAISNAVASLPPEQMYELMRQMKVCVRNNPAEARTLLMNNPQLAYALLQAQVVMRIVDPKTAIQILHGPIENAEPLPVAPPPMIKKQPPMMNGSETPNQGPPMHQNQNMRGAVPPPIQNQPPQHMNMNQGPPLPGPNQFNHGPPPLSGQGPPNMGGPVFPVQPPNQGQPRLPNQDHINNQNKMPPNIQNQAPPRPVGMPPHMQQSGPFGQNQGAPRPVPPPGRDFDLREMGGPKMPLQPGPDQDMRRGPPPGGPGFNNRMDIRDRGAPRDRDIDRRDRDMDRRDRDIDRRDRGIDRDMREPRGERGFPQDKDFRSGGPMPSSLPPGPANPPRSVPPPNAPSANVPNQDQEKANLIMQVLQLSDEQIKMLPPEQQASIMQLKQQIQRSSQ